MGDMIKVDRVGMATIGNHPKRLVFISDLHLDCVAPEPLPLEEHKRILEKISNGEVVPERPEHEEDGAFLEKENAFMQFIKERFPNDILILAGDVYADFQRPHSFIRKWKRQKLRAISF